MTKTMQGDCPVFQEERTVEVEYRTMRQIGAPPQEKPVRVFCEDYSPETCKLCPFLVKTV